MENNILENENLKECLDIFYDKMKNTENGVIFDVIIDDMCKNDSDILLEYILNYIKNEKIFSDIINYKTRFEIEDMKDSVIVVDDFYLFFNDLIDVYDKKNKLMKFFLKLKLNDNMIIITCPKKINEYFENDKDIQMILDKSIHLSGEKNSKVIYNNLIKKYNENNIKSHLSYSIFLKIKKELENNYYVKHQGIVEYIYEYSKKKIILDNTFKVTNSTFYGLIQEEKPKTKKIELENLVGLNNIKKELSTLYNYLEFNKKLKNKDSLYLNLFFLGNPGTGKTTVARLYSSKLYKMGFIKEDKLIEITPNDLIGKYLGDTRFKAREIFSKSKDGVLFIDEAYLLYTDNYSKGKNPYMEEAIVELVKYLEDPKNVVIFAGYPDEMKKIYNANPGIKSRIYGEIVFDDYTKDELYQILDSEFKNKGLEIDKKSKTKIINYIDEMKKDLNFGNARSIKQLSQKMIMNHVNKSKTVIIDYKDLPPLEKEEKFKMGFDVYDRR